jgi:hypothetical protein
MPKYYIHAEAFNLDPIVYDTHDISTIRGGSFMLLDAIQQIPAAIPGRLRPIATAASKGVFAYEDPGDLAAQRKPEGMALKVLHALHDATGGHATFLVAVEEDIPNDFSLVLAHLEAEVRRQQWRMPTVVVPSFEDTNQQGTNQECYLDGWRPGVEPYTVDPDVKAAKMSVATSFRRDKGRRFKRTLFRQLLNDPVYGDDLVTKDLGKLATDQSKGILNGKIAFIHVDGNSFGRIRNALCTAPEARTAFDKAIQEDCRNAFLRDLLARARADPNFQVVEGGATALRIELLLWGGDEFTLVVPAWKGLEVLERFYRIADGLAFEGVPMTHRAVVIFCHHNAPILQIRRLAEELLTVTKSNITARFKAALETDSAFASLAPEERDLQVERLSNAEYGNAARYLVLESFDMLRGSLDRFLERYYGKADTGDLLLYGRRLAELREHLNTICAAAPKGRVVEVAHAISKGDTARADELRKGLPDSVAPDQRDAVRSAIDVLTRDSDAGWYLLADLWDYAEEWKA